MAARIVITMPHKFGHLTHNTWLIPAIAIFALLYRAALRIVYWLAWRKTTPYAIPSDTARTASLVAALPIPRPWLTLYLTVLILPLPILLISGYSLYHDWSTLPGTFPLAWLSGQYQNVSPHMAAVLHHAAWLALLHSSIGTLALVFCAWLGSLWLALAFTFRARLSDWTEDITADDRYRRLLMLGSAWTGLITVLFLIALVLYPILRARAGYLHISLVTAAALFLAGSYYNLSFFFRTYSERPKRLRDGTLDTHWKLGQIYWNPSDPAWIVPNRVGAGQALNLGRPAAWIPIFLSLSALILWPGFDAQLPDKAIHSTTPEWAAYRVALDQVKHSTGNREPAAQALLEFAQNHVRPRNYIAVTLAQAGLHLPEAQALAERSVQHLERRTALADPLNMQPEDLKRVNLLAQFWDGLGQVYLTQGKLDAAQHYIEAAWNLSQQGAFALHLGQLALARNDKPTARNWFTQATGHILNPDDLTTAFDGLAATGERSPDFRTFLFDTGPIPIPANPTPQGNARLELVFRKDQAPQILWPNGPQALTSIPAQTILQSIPTQIPDAGPELIVRYAELTCRPTKSCHLRFLPTGKLPEEDGGQIIPKTDFTSSPPHPKPIHPV
jgi:tetratricopeptide (TPR) repeat protein